MTRRMEGKRDEDFTTCAVRDKNNVMYVINSHLQVCKNLPVIKT